LNAGLGGMFLWVGIRLRVPQFFVPLVQEPFLDIIIDVTTFRDDKHQNKIT
jgi:hypothetical protein